jgi:hypothetical protein
MNKRKPTSLKVWAIIAAAGFCISSLLASCEFSGATTIAASATSETSTAFTTSYASSTTASSSTFSSDKPTSTLQESERPAPAYKIPERIHMTFRPEWIWNDALGDYEDTAGLKRDPETGLFPKPVVTPEGLADYATWDPHLGLYIINTIHIDYKNDSFYEEPPEYDPSSEIHWPKYNINEEDRFNNAYRHYLEFIDERYPFNPFSSAPRYIDLGVFTKYNLTPAWFGMSILDIPMVINKLEAGAPPAFTMTLIMLLTHTDIGIVPSIGATYRYIEWVNTFNVIKSQIPDRVARSDITSVGYLALPLIYGELKNNLVTNMALLPDITAGLDDCTKVVTSSWDKTQWLSWFNAHEAELWNLQWLIDHQINMPWLK